MLKLEELCEHENFAKIRPQNNCLQSKINEIDSRILEKKSIYNGYEKKGKEQIVIHMDALDTKMAITSQEGIKRNITKKVNDICAKIIDIIDVIKSNGSDDTINNLEKEYMVFNSMIDALQVESDDEDNYFDSSDSEDKGHQSKKKVTIEAKDLNKKKKVGDIQSEDP